MHIVLLSGGSGKRLWPLSNDSRSKQFLKLLKDQNDNFESMVQRVWRQIRHAGLENQAVIATSKSQAEILRYQLGSELNLIIEPERRDTFPAIALAAAFLHSELQVDRGEIVAVLPVDPYVEDSFFTKIKELEAAFENQEADLALMGVSPAFPSEKYGYIVPENADSSGKFRPVKTFKEKPDQEAAAMLIDQGALWNCGIFAFRLSFILEILSDKGYLTDYRSLLEQYRDLPKISFDYEVVEKAKDIVVLPYQGEWKDLGTWNTLAEEMSSTLVGNGIISEDSVNTNVVNELDIPVAVLGLSDVIVAASPDGILVSHKDASPRVKEIATFEQRPMYVERRWGWYKVLDYTRTEQGEEAMVKKVCLHAGKNLSYHVHWNRNEVWTILKGEGTFVHEGQVRKVSANDVLHIPSGTKHAIYAEAELELIEVQQGSDLSEADVQRIYITWDEISEAFIQ
jgi:mannose-1-phosphate guanylyltransferase